MFAANANGQGRCAAILDLADRRPNEDPYQGVVPLTGNTVAETLEGFMTMSEQGLEATKIMNALALALKTTALGLVVAIISMVFNNILVRYSERFLAAYDEEI